MTRGESARTMLNVGICAMLGVVVAIGEDSALAVLGGSLVLLVIVAGQRMQLPLAARVSVGILAVMIVMSRGFSHLGVRIGPLPVYPGEVFLLFGLMHTISGGRKIVWESPVARLTLLVIVLSLPVAVAGIPVWGIDALRDYAIVYYMLAIPVGAAVFREDEVRRFALRVLRSALLVHVLYVAAVLLFRQSLEAAGPSFDGVPLFSIRGDFDALMLIGLPVWLLAERRANLTVARWEWAIASLGLLEVFALDVRAAIVALGVLLVIWLLLGEHRAGAAIVGSLLVLAVLGQLVATSPLAPHRSDSSNLLELAVSNVVGVLPGWGNVEQNANANLRLRWWSAVVEWTAAEPTSLLFGRGFGRTLAIGPEFQVGYAEGNYARSPHNGYVTLFARVGVLGSLAWLTIVGLPCWRTFTRRPWTQQGGEEWWTLAVLGIVVVVGVGAFFGVILESPFGALVFYFFVGALLCVGDQQNRITQSVLPARGE